MISRQKFRTCAYTDELMFGRFNDVQESEVVGMGFSFCLGMEGGGGGLSTDGLLNTLYRDECLAKFINF